MDLLIPKSWIVLIVGCVHIGFFICTIICLLLRLIRGKEISKRAANVQYAANFIFAVATVVDILIWLSVYFLVRVDNENGGVAIYKNPLSQNDGYILLIGTIGYWIVGLLFFIHFFRASWSLSLLALLLLNATYIGSFLIDHFSGSDYEQWSMQDEGIFIKTAQTLVFAIFTTFVYLIFYKRKSLPYS
jgi:hypothetical protein